jgi:hypothetical protein
MRVGVDVGPIRNMTLKYSYIHTLIIQALNLKISYEDENK